MLYMLVKISTRFQTEKEGVNFRLEIREYYHKYLK